MRLWRASKRNCSTDISDAFSSSSASDVGGVGRGNAANTSARRPLRAPAERALRASALSRSASSSFAFAMRSCEALPSAFSKVPCLKPSSITLSTWLLMSGSAAFCLFESSWATFSWCTSRNAFKRVPFFALPRSVLKMVFFKLPTFDSGFPAPLRASMNVPLSTLFMRTEPLTTDGASCGSTTSSPSRASTRSVLLVDCSARSSSSLSEKSTSMSSSTSSSLTTSLIKVLTKRFAHSFKGKSSAFAWLCATTFVSSIKGAF
mmetsp:Transcript_38681/g.97221  ORF Transcript_38681/g.97221 Transcript_38681/m.97221 type:complete len:262 (-) Transcript_38681:339-1124(-)